MSKARASHILVKTQVESENLKKEIEGGAAFEDVAKKHSLCPSRARGGDLGEFGPGQMVAEFDKAVFSGTVGQVIGPVKTQFGYHLIKVVSRA